MALVAPRAGAALPEPIAIGALASKLNATVVGNGAVVVDRLGHCADGSKGTLAFFRDVPHGREWIASGGPAAIASITASESLQSPWDNASRALLVVKDADAALLEVLRLIQARDVKPLAGTDATAIIHPGASVDPTATIGPYCVVGMGAKIGPRTVLASQVTIGAGAIIGPDCLLHAGTRVLDLCTLGARVILQANAVIGADGFGYTPTARGLAKVPHVGTVVIEDDVEIGANSCVDRAKFGETRIGQGTKIDNLVQVAHNCTIGKHCVLCGQAGLAGGVTLGDGVVLGGKVGVADGVTIGSGAKVAGHGGVASDLAGGETYMGAPAWPANEWRRIFAAIRILPRLMPAIRKLARENDAGK